MSCCSVFNFHCHMRHLAEATILRQQRKMYIIIIIRITVVVFIYFYQHSVNQASNQSTIKAPSTSSIIIR